MFSSNTTQVSDGGYQISRSLRFNSADSAYLNRTPATATNRRTFTFSAWVKLSKTSDDPFLMGAGSGGQIWITGDKIRVRLNGSPDYYYDTAAVFRDYSAWYHIVVGVDTTNATSADRVKIYVNSTQQTIGASSAPPQNFDTEFNLASTVNQIGKWPSGSQYLNGYMTEVNFIDGQALTPSSFGETNAQTGVWQPKAYSGSYGTNGFYLNFSDNSNTTAATLGKDYSGNGNNWTPNNFSVTAGAGNDSLVDSPTSYGTDTGVGGTVRGNYATLNPLTYLNATFANGNLDTVVAVPETSNAVGTFGVSSGQWYWEITPTTTDAGMIGVCDISASASNRSWQSANGWAYFKNGNKYNNNSGSAYGASWVANDVIGVALDMDAGTLVFYKNGTSQGTAYSTGLSGKTITAYLGNGNGLGGASQYYSANFGQRPFAYTAPSGYKALCTQNLPTPTVGATSTTQAGKFFNPVIWTGTGANPRTITGVGFQPDWVWVKKRSAAGNNFLQDAVRGVTSTDSRSLVSNNTDVETNYYTTNGGVTAFASDGFTTSGGSTNLNLNESGVTYIAWNWKANGSGSTNTAGSITSTVSANTTSGFSIVTYTGNGSLNATFGHGLGVVPSMIIVKSRSNANAWPIYHSALGANKYIYLNLTQAPDTVGGLWGASGPSSSLVYLPTSTSQGEVNGSGTTYVAYCFAEVAGYSKFGSYTGNGSADGPFVFTGMRPAYVLIKKTSAADEWFVWDSKRSTINQITGGYLIPSGNYAEGAVNAVMDLVSNGFKIRGTDTSWNLNGATFIFAAFAENPFKYSLAR